MLEMAAITAALHVTVALADKDMAQAIGMSGRKQEGRSMFNGHVFLSVQM